MNLLSVSIQNEFRKLYVLDQNFTKMTLILPYPKFSAKCIIRDTNDLENYGQGHEASLGIQVN